MFVSGQIPLDPKSGALVVGDIEAQTERVISNLHAIFEAAGTSLARVVRTTVYVTDLTLFGRVNEVYARYFDENPPARTFVAVASWPMEFDIEIECIALA